MNVMDIESLDIEEDGPLRAFLDDFIENGIPDPLRRAFAGWLEKTIQDLQDQRDDAVRDYRDLKDEHPDQVIPPPEAATFYVKTRERAELNLKPLLTDPRVASGEVFLDQYNGYYCALTPKYHDIKDLAPHAEIKDGTHPRPVKGRAGPGTVLNIPDGGAEDGPDTPKFSPDTPHKARQGGSQGDAAGSAPTKGATARVWEIADGVVAKGSWDRNSIIAACVAAGINQATAGTQYSKWRKARGL